MNKYLFLLASSLILYSDNTLIKKIPFAILHRCSNFNQISVRIIEKEYERCKVLSEQLPEAEIIHEGKDRHGDDLMYLQQGDEFLRFGYQRIFPFYGEWSAQHFTGKDGVICLPDQETVGVILALGDLGDVRGAELELHASPDRTQPRTLHWTVEGERENDRAFRFVLPERTDEETMLAERLRQDACPEAYYDWTLRLYDGDGGLLRTLTGPAKG